MNRDFLPAEAAQGSVRLSDWGVIRAQGPEAAAFLQGQLTQDVQSMAPDAARLAGYCSPKGRLLASFVAWRPQPETVLLACSADLLPTTLKRLSMYVLRAKVKLDDAGSAIVLHGVAGARSAETLGLRGEPWQVVALGDLQAVRLPDVQATQRWLVAAPPDWSPALPSLDAGAWALMEALSGVPRITSATVEQFVPQMVNMEALQGVNFRKGCYPGQEVVARSQYRGTLKRRSFVFESAEAARPGQEVFHEADPDQPAGMVVDAGSFDGRHAVFAEVKLSAIESGALRLGSPQGALLQPLGLPYELPAEGA